MLKVLILTEGGGKTGWGHLTRCLALSQGLEEAGCQWRGVVNAQGVVPSAVSGPQWVIEDWRHIHGGAKNSMCWADYVIIDSYLASAGVYEKIYTLNPNLIVIDDNNRIEYPSCILINPNIYGKQMVYPDAYRVWAGEKYILLRQPFWDVQPKTFGPLQSVLITLGGGDFQSLKNEILRFLAGEYPDLKKTVIDCGREGLSNENKDGDANTIFLRDVDANKMRDVMVASDVAISAGGQTLAELARTGVPAVAFTLAGNQRRNVEAWSTLGFVQKADEKDIDGAKILMRTFIGRGAQDRNDIAVKVMKMVDGQGARRIVANLIGGRALAVRRAVPDDCEDLWKWRNDPVVRKVSFNQEEISLDAHRQWFEIKLKDPNVSIYILEDNGDVKLGQVRFEANGDMASIHVNMNPAFIGRGLGKYAISEGTRVFLQERPGISCVKAEVFADNLSSQKVFEKAGYVSQGTESRNNRKLYVFMFRR